MSGRRTLIANMTLRNRLQQSAITRDQFTLPLNYCVTSPYVLRQRPKVVGRNIPLFENISLAGEIDFADSKQRGCPLWPMANKAWMSEKEWTGAFSYGLRHTSLL